MKLYKREIVYHGDDGSTTYKYQELSPTELEALGKKLNVAGMKVMEELENWTKKMGGFGVSGGAIRQNIKNLKEKHLSSSSLDEIRKKLVQAEAWNGLRDWLARDRDQRRLLEKKDLRSRLMPIFLAQARSQLER